MVDDHGYIQWNPRGNSGETADRKADTLGKTTQKVECSEQKNGKREPILLEKALKTRQNVEKNVSLHDFYKFSTWINI